MQQALFDAAEPECRAPGRIRPPSFLRIQALWGQMFWRPPRTSGSFSVPSSTS